MSVSNSVEREGLVQMDCKGSFVDKLVEFANSGNFAEEDSRSPIGRPQTSYAFGL
jgi:hypothetical protein